MIRNLTEFDADVETRCFERHLSHKASKRHARELRDHRNAKRMSTDDTKAPTGILVTIVEAMRATTRLAFVHTTPLGA